jgi:hypothetical protein
MSNAIIFPSDPFNARKVDEEFQIEADLVKTLGGKVVLVDHTELENGNFFAKNLLTAEKASLYDNRLGQEDEDEIRASIPENIVYDSNAFYRGWMMTSGTYQLMRWKLGTRLVEMVTNTSDYSAGYYFGNWYELFEDITPRSVYFPVDSPFYEGMTKFVREELGDGRYIVKDHVKSRKADWDTACYVPDIDSLEKVVNEFVRLQGEYLAGGVVIRQFEDFVKEEGEARVWWVGNKPVMISPHPDTPSLLPAVDVDFVAPYLERLNRPFVTTDLALRTDGVWRVVEVSDGQVSGIPRGFDASPLFTELLRYKND